MTDKTFYVFKANVAAIAGAIAADGTAEETQVKLLEDLQETFGDASSITEFREASAEEAEKLNELYIEQEASKEQEEIPALLN